MDWSTAGPRVAAAGGPDVTVWEPDRPEAPFVTLVGGTEAVHDLAWSIEGERLATGGRDSTIRIWTAGRPGPPRSSRPAGWTVSAVAWHPDGVHLAGATTDGTTTIWDPSDLNAPSAIMPGHHAWVNGMEWSRGGWLATASDDGTVLVRDGARLDEPSTLVTSSDVGQFYTVAWSPDGRWLATAGPPDIGIWAIDRPDRVETVLVHPDELVADLAWDHDGIRLAAAGGASVTIWAPDTPDAPLAVLHGRTPIHSVRWETGGSLLATADDSGLVQVWDPTAPDEPLARLDGHTGPARRVAWVPGGTDLVSVGDDGLIRRGPPLPDRGWHLSAAHISWMTRPLSAPHDPAPNRWGGIVADRPSARDDLLGARDIAVGLDELLRRELGGDHVDRTVAANIDGAWGRGKSTLHEHLVDLDDRERDGHPRWLAVHHDAWRHSRTSPSWWALVRDLRGALDDARTPAGRRRLARAETAHRVSAAVGWPRAALALALVVRSPPSSPSPTWWRRPTASPPSPGC